MRKLFATAAVLAFGFVSPSMAATSAECSAHWAKMDSSKTGYVLMSNADAKGQMDMMNKAGRKTAAADRITAKEFMDSCLADVLYKSSQ